MAQDDPLDALQGWLTLLPALALAIPAGLLHNVPTTTSAGIGWSLVLTLPAVVLLALRRRPVAFGGSTLLLGVLVAASFLGSRAGDPFEARRAVLVLCLGFALCLSGASLAQAGRRVLLRGLSLSCLAYLLGTLVTPAWSGVVGNTGHTAQAALPGAVCGIAVALSSRGALRLAALASSAAFAIYVGLVPVLAGMLALGSSAGMALLAGATRMQTARVARVALLFTAVAATSLGARELYAAGGNLAPEPAAGGDQAMDAPAPQAPGDFGGIQFRWRTWAAATASLLPTVLLTGTGPGQFAREFPPHRDPQERVGSSLNGLEPTPVEVEHAHNDWLQGLLELGLLGGSAWLAFLGLALLGSWRTLCSDELVDAGLGAAATACLVGALVNAPLLASPAAPAATWPLLGVVLARPAGRTRLAAWLPGLATVLLLLRTDAAWSFAQHGEALAGLADVPRFEQGGVEGLQASGVAPHLAAALRACPDSVVALEKRDEWLRATGAPAGEREQTLARLLEARPHRLAALLNLGAVLAERRRFSRAKPLLLHAHELAPEDRRVARNLARLGAESYDHELMLATSAELLADPEFDRTWLYELASQLLLAGRPDHGRELLALVEPDLDLSSGEEAYALGMRLDASGGEGLLAEAAQVTANQLWARADIATGTYGTAVRLYRQAVQTSRHHLGLPGGDTLLRLELAGALVLAGSAQEADLEVTRAAATALHWAQLPTWAGQALIDAGLMR